MSGECEVCWDHTLDCSCNSRGRYILAKTCGSGCPCHYRQYNTHLNLVRKNRNERTPVPPIKWINIRGREEHEAIIKNSQWCKELGLDQNYEVSSYLKRWGTWLNGQY